MAARVDRYGMKMKPGGSGPREDDPGVGGAHCLRMSEGPRAPPAYAGCPGWAEGCAGDAGRGTGGVMG